MPPTPYRVLVVDDQPHVRANVCRYLDSTRYQAVEVGDKVSLLEALSTQNFRLIITDLGLPDFDAEQLMQAIMNHTTYPDTQVILLPPLAADRPCFKPPEHWRTVHVPGKPFPPQCLKKLLASLEATNNTERAVSH